MLFELRRLYRFDNILHESTIIFCSFRNHSRLSFWSKIRRKIFYTYYSEWRIIKLQSRTINAFRCASNISHRVTPFRISNENVPCIPREIISNWVRDASARFQFGTGERKEGEKRVARAGVLNSYENPNSIRNNPGWVFTRSLRNTVCL